MLHAVGFADGDFKKPQVGIASTWSNRDAVQHAHRRAGASKPRRASKRRAARPITFNTITVSDGISMGTPGMSYSLVSREVIADSIETVVGCAGLRRGRGHRRLRQEHAGLA